MGVGNYFSLVKFAHTLFALPFALIGYTYGVLAVGFDPWVLVKVLLCMVFARNAAMGFNRVIDRKFDAQNPRTAGREIPAGVISVKAGKWFVTVNVIGFLVVAGLLNWLTLALAPVALAVILGYSYMKRFSPLAHMVLGLGLGIAPSAAYIAVTGTLNDWFPVVISGLVFTWVSGFDIIYALQDAAFDKERGLRSIPSWLGIRKSIVVSIALHILTAILVLGIGLHFFPESWLYWIGAAIFCGMLIYQHAIVRPNDLSRVGPGFTMINGGTSVAYATFVILAMTLGI